MNEIERIRKAVDNLTQQLVDETIGHQLCGQPIDHLDAAVANLCKASNQLGDKAVLPSMTTTGQHPARRLG